MGYIVVRCRAYVSPGGESLTGYATDGQEFATRDEAVAHGFDGRVSDDFLNGRVVDGRLVDLRWMDEPKCQVELASAASCLGMVGVTHGR